MNRLSGSCLCGAVRYEADDAFMYAGYCHCSQCRKFSGAAASPFGGIKETALRVTQGASLIGAYEKGSDTTMHFCSRCGSSLYSRKPVSGLVHIRLGTLDETPSLPPQAHVHIASKADWEVMGEDDLPRFDTTPLVR